MSAYDELVRDVARVVASYDGRTSETAWRRAEMILSLVRAHVENPTPAMILASENDQPEWNWKAMLSVSPLVSPKEI